MAPILHAAVSDVGRVRRENQDAFGEFSSAAGERLFVVADGMGGHRGGSTASRLCVETIGHAFEGREPVEARLRRGFALANTRIHEAAEADPELVGMGTTAVAVAFGPDGSAALAWVGDSRVYRLRDGALELLSSDHSIVGEMVRSGALAPELAESHPRRNELMRAIGPLASVEAETRVLRHAPGDRFLLCTDGLWGPVPLAELAEVLGGLTPERAVAKLVALANERGGPDNVTALVASVEGGATSSGTRSARTAARSAQVLVRVALGAALVATLLALATLLLS